jgi:hypothetical protein
MTSQTGGRTRKKDWRGLSQTRTVKQPRLEGEEAVFERFTLTWKATLFVAAIAILFAGSSFGQLTPLHENWEDDAVLPNVDWGVVVQSSGTTYPFIEDFGNPGKSLNMGGTGDGHKARTYHKTFRPDYSFGLVTEFDVYLSGSGSHYTDAQVLLSTSPDDFDAGTTLLMWFNKYSSNQRRVWMCLYSSDPEHDEQLILSDAYISDTWNHGKVVVRPDQRVEFYVNDLLLWTSTKTIDPANATNTYLCIEGQSYNGPARLDNLLVTGVPDTLRIGRPAYQSQILPACVRVPVYLYNYRPTAAGRFPLTYDWDSDPDSVSFVNTRLEGMDVLLANIDPTENVIDVMFVADFGPGYLPPVDASSADIPMFWVYLSLDCDLHGMSLSPPETTTVCAVEDCFGVRTVDTYALISVPEVVSNSLLVKRYMPGDVNASGNRDIDDIVYLIHYVFTGGPEPAMCLMVGDCNGDCSIDIDDIMWLIDFIFRAGPLPVDGCSVKSSLAKASIGTADIIVASWRKAGRSGTSLYLDADRDVRGLQLEFETHGDVANLSVSSTLEGVQLFSGWVDGRFKVGLLDVQGQALIPAGKNDIVTFSYTGEGDVELVKTIAVAKGGGHLDVTVSKDASTATLPIDFSLDQNHPNPFNPSTEISFSLPVASNVRLDVFNIMGQTVATLVNGNLQAGKHSVVWNGKSSAGETAASGVYFYKIEAAGFTDVKKMLLMK